jgi:CheY-like chemotaxis protein
LSSYHLEKVREILNNPNIPAIISSGDTEPQRMQEISAKGFEVLHKPIKPSQLRSLMNHLLSKNYMPTQG